MTTHNDMIMEYGGVPVGAGRLAKIFQAKNIFFVDYDTGSDGWTGKKPRKATKTIDAAVGYASKEGIIYIRPRTTVACADVYYSENLVIPVTKPHVQLIGAGAGTVPGYRGSAQIRVSAADDDIIKIQSSGVCIENLHICTEGQDAGHYGVFAHRTATYPGCVSTQIRHCRFTGQFAIVSGTMVGFGSNQYSIIEDNIFFECMYGINLSATHGSPASHTVRRNTFGGRVLSRDYDIGVVMTDIYSRGHIIEDNIFADGVPAHASAAYQYFIWMSAAASAASTGIISGNRFASAGAVNTTFGKTGDEGLISAGWFLVENHNETGLITRKD